MEDLIDLVLQALDGVGPSGVYHVSSGRDCAIRDLLAAIEQTYAHLVSSRDTLRDLCFARRIDYVSLDGS